MSGIQKILHAECEGFLFVLNLFAGRVYLSACLFSTFFAGRMYGQTLLESQVVNFSGLSPDLIRDVVTLNLPGFEKVHLTTSIFSARLLNAFASEVISLSL